MSDRGGFPYWMMWGGSPTRETKQVSPTTENLIPLLHMLGIAAATLFFFLTLASVVAVWFDGARWFAIRATQVATGCLTVVMTIILLLQIKRAGPAPALVILTGGGFLTVFMVDIAHAEVRFYCWLVTFLGAGFGLACVLWAISGWRELINPWRPLDPRSEVMMAFAKAEMRVKEMEGLRILNELQRQGIDIPPSVSGDWQQKAWGRDEAFMAFLQDATEGTSRDFLRDHKGWHPDAIKGYEELLIRQGFARRKGRGWELTVPVGMILEHYVNGQLYAYGGETRHNPPPPPPRSKNNNTRDTAPVGEGGIQATLRRINVSLSENAEEGG